MTLSPNPRFALSFGGTIWRIITDATGALLVVEIQGVNEHDKHFAAVDTLTGELLWQDFTIPTYQSVHAAALHDNVLYLQVIRNGQPPQPEAIIAVDTATRQVKWQRSKSAWMGVTSGGPVVREVGYDQLRYFILDEQNGAVRQEAALAEMQFLEEDSNHIRRPVYYDQASSYTASIAQFIGAKLGVTPVYAFDYAEKGQALIISYYLCQNNQYENFLAVFDYTGCLLWQQKIAGALPGIGSNTFLITNDWLIFVKEKNQLLGYVL